MGALAPGRQLNRYRIESAIAAGGMGEVYRAFDTTLQRIVALKVLRTDDGRMPSPEQRARFLREARASAALRHPNIVTVFDVGEADALPFIAMELLEGRSLDELVAEDIPIARKRAWLVQIAEALAAAHAAGFIHRDIKPANLVVGPDDNVKVLDFGVVRTVRSEEIVFGTPERPAASFRTAYGNIVGTPRYMAPEQAAGWTVDARIDQFAWGLVAYELLCGRRPSAVDSGFSADHGWRSPAPPLPQPDVAGPMAAIIARALEREAAARFKSMAELLAGLGFAHQGLDAPVPMTIRDNPVADNTLAHAATQALPPAVAATHPMAAPLTRPVSGLPPRQSPSIPAPSSPAPSSPVLSSPVLSSHAPSSPALSSPPKPRPPLALWLAIAALIVGALIALALIANAYRAVLTRPPSPIRAPVTTPTEVPSKLHLSVRVVDDGYPETTVRTAYARGIAEMEACLPIGHFTTTATYLGTVKTVVYADGRAHVGISCSEDGSPTCACIRKSFREPAAPGRPTTAHASATIVLFAVP